MGVDLRLSLQRALLGEVGPNLRAVTCSWEEDCVKIRAIFDGPISDEDTESIGVAATEVVSDLPSEWNGSFEEEIIRVDAPQTFRDHLLDHVVYMRRESEVLDESV